MRVATIVEGDSEVESVPLLLRRLQRELRLRDDLEFARPIRVRRDRFLRRDGEFTRFVALAATQAGSDGSILIVLDADDDCPATEGPRTLARAVAAARGTAVSVVFAHHEYESWFIAAAESLVGCRDFVLPAPVPADAERARDAKGWIRSGMPGRAYDEIRHQPALTARMDLAAARAGSRSFRKLCDDLTRTLRPPN